MRYVAALLCFALLCFALLCISAPNNQVRSLALPLRSRTEVFRGSGDWQEVRLSRALPASETAIIICDMWDKHWCRGATDRVAGLASRMAPLLDLARSRGIQIVHAPSEVMQFYRETPQRVAIMNLPKVDPPASRNLTDPPLPIDDSNGGCDTGDAFYKAWTREHPALRIAPGDVISDDGKEVYTFLHSKGIKNLLFMGVHTNMCILKRSFAIRQMTNWGMRCILVRDLTDTMYNPQDRPFVSHDQGTELVVQHIEKYWGPSVLSHDLISALNRKDVVRQP